MAGKTGQAKLNAAIKRVFSDVLDLDEPLPEHVTLKREDIEAVLLSYRELMRALKAHGIVIKGTGEAQMPNLHPGQQ